MKRLTVFFCALCCAVPLSAAGGENAPQAKKSNLADQKTQIATSSRVQSLEKSVLASELERIGRADSNPLALVLAAQLLDEVGGVQQARVKSSMGAVAAKMPAYKPAKAPQTAAGLYKEARQLAAGDRAITALIDRLSSAGSKGNVDGPVEHSDVVNANSTDVYEIQFAGDQTAGVLVRGDGDTDLDLFVFDEHDNLICSDEDSSDEAFCVWTPAWTGTFSVQVKNFGDVANRYEISTN
jgi:hypothetical protein